MWGFIKRATVALLAFVSTVRGHGYLADPAARNVQHNSDYCPGCLNAGGPWLVYSAGRGRPRYGVCGDPWNGPKHHEAGGKYATPIRTARTFKSGQVFTARVVLTANHVGRWSLRLCPRIKPTQSCFDAHVLQRADGKGPYTPVPGNKSTFRVRYKLPRGLKCKRCVVQWTYETGNSCNPPGIPRPNPGLDSCKRSTNGEQFWNCADVRIV
jgi:hypothetical protein